MVSYMNNLIFFYLNLVYEYVREEENSNPLNQENSTIVSVDQMLCLQSTFWKSTAIRYSHQTASEQIE